ncbi:hypothetical protein FB45DRAFT_839780 [Roridomyces roridus]|uniref:BTB domain-containing protein n=1 Tax=Roridomyces roridus TaxID=1738132 RepID=A0AAD7FHM0_9AGAR|nr:hypothetical protein FB45DRAFT_839780 [Roridomyces roridus]
MSNTMQGVKQSKNYWLTGGDVHLIVEDCEFCVHRYFFVRDSAKFRELLTPAEPASAPAANGKSAPAPAALPASTHLTAIKLPNVTTKEFETFLWVFYNPTYSLYDASVSDWTTILRLGKRWEFVEVEKLAIRELEKLPMPVVDRIVLYLQYSAASEEHFIPHYATLCKRGHPLSLEESNELGMNTVVLINQVLHALHAPASSVSTDPLVVRIVTYIKGAAGTSTQKRLLKMAS